MPYADPNSHHTWIPAPVDQKMVITDIDMLRAAGIGEDLLEQLQKCRKINNYITVRDVGQEKE